MTFALEYDNDEATEAPGPFRLGSFNTVEAAMNAGSRLSDRPGFVRFVVRNKGESVSPTDGEVVAVLVDGNWQPCS